MKNSRKSLFVLGCAALGIAGATGCGVAPDAAEEGRLQQASCVVMNFPFPTCNNGGLELRYVCDVITQNTTCDAIANMYHSDFIQLGNLQCNRAGLEALIQPLQDAIAAAQLEMQTAMTQEAAMCAYMKFQSYQQQLMNVQMQLAMISTNIHCLLNQLAIHQCEFARCLATPACKPILAHGTGAPGSSCTDGSQCETGLCLAGTNTCAARPPNYCCLAAVDNQCPMFDMMMSQCLMSIQMQTNGYPYTGGSGGTGGAGLVAPHGADLE